MPGILLNLGGDPANLPSLSSCQKSVVFACFPLQAFGLLILGKLMTIRTQFRELIRSRLACGILLFQLGKSL
jgi:hypothetical protein